MHVIHERCAGIDVHKKTVVVCVLITQANGVVEKQICTFRTMMADLLALDEWLRGQRIEHIAMGSTGVYYEQLSCTFGQVDICVSIIAKRRFKNNTPPCFQSETGHFKLKQGTYSVNGSRLSCRVPSTCLTLLLSRLS